MKRSHIPSIGGLTSFVAAAQQGSFTGAARELNLSQGAVSRQIRELEDYLGIRLFDRIRQRVVLTEAGKLYLSHVKKPLDDLAFAAKRIAAFSAGTNLNLAVLPTLASRWLMPRLPGFQKQHPGVMIHLTTPQSTTEFSMEPFDAGIMHLAPNWPGTIAHHLIDVDMVAMCSPKLNAKGSVNAPADLLKFPLLHLMARPDRWAEWMAQAGAPVDTPLPGHSYQNSTMVAQAAVSGLGVALMPRRLFEDELADDRLEIIGSHFPSTKISYYLVLSEAVGRSDVTAAFVTWLMTEARAWMSAKERVSEAAQCLDEPIETATVVERRYRGRGAAR